MAKKLMADCPCGFSFVTPHGEEDAVALVQYHVERIHKKDYPRGVSKSEAMKYVKEVK